MVTNNMTYIISVNYVEDGPYTLEQLEEFAKERKFTWGHFVLKMGDSRWYPVWELSETKAILEKNFVLKSGDIGPTGGMVFFNDIGEQRHVMEAAPYDLGPVPRGDAEKLCMEYRAGGVEWKFPDEDEVRCFAVARYHSPNKVGSYAYGNRTVLHWCSLIKEGKANAVCTQEFYDTYNPYAQRPTSSRGPWIGNTVESEESAPLPVRPVRLIMTIPKPPEQKQEPQGYGSRALPPE
jgi:hypothetical protein